MKAIRAVIIVIFLAAVGIYGLAEYQEMANADPNRPQLVSETERIVVPCDYTEEDIMEGLSAYDEEDGDLTGGDSSGRAVPVYYAGDLPGYLRGV